MSRIHEVQLHRPVTPGDPTPQPPGHPVPDSPPQPEPVSDPPPVRASVWGCSRHIVEGYERPSYRPGAA